MNRIVSLAMVICILMTILVSCEAPIRKADENDFTCQLSTSTWYEYPIVYNTAILHVENKVEIKNLIIEVNFLDENGVVIKSYTSDLGDVEQGSATLFCLDPRHVPSGNLPANLTYEIKVIEGYVIQW